MVFASSLTIESTDLLSFRSGANVGTSDAGERMRMKWCWDRCEQRHTRVGMMGSREAQDKPLIPSTLTWTSNYDGLPTFRH